MAEMFEKFANIFRIPDLRKRVLFMLGILAVYRLGAWIPTPGVDTAKLAQMFALKEATRAVLAAKDADAIYEVLAEAERKLGTGNNPSRR